MALAFSGTLDREGGSEQSMLAGGSDFGDNGSLWIGLRGGRVTVAFGVKDGDGKSEWLGPTITPPRFDFRVLLDPSLGPGGVLARLSDDRPWTTMKHSSSRGAEALRWPVKWSLGGSYVGAGLGEEGERSDIFRGSSLRIAAHVSACPLPGEDP